ncbi:hypothetical protein HYC85_001857 [Camellia sinensis]|uniref:GBF-interacting protein 1 N-terminal domain-containing protein n=1 Tax=Camellia sinensis TaxID=4442 RepID=A0A7J7I8Y5_CAMSI|nr:hypothetical protein HYC85_001857 [Camellia sinensis]
MSSGARVSIPNSVRKTIQNIKEIMGNHSEDEIYAMLKECSMDPNETAQKLLHQDTFHEVKKKRDRRKENLSNKDSAESRWRPGMQGRGSRGGRGNYPPRHTSNDASGGRNSAPGKENVINQVSEMGASLPSSQDMKNKEVTPVTSSQTVLTNGPTAMVPGSTAVVHAAHLSLGSSANQSEEGSAVDISNLQGLPPLLHPVNAKENPSIDFGTGDIHGQFTSSSSNSSTAGTQAPLPGVYFSASDPVLVPSHDLRLPGAVGAIKREVGSQRTPVEQNSLVTLEGKSTAVGPSKEWKPKPTNANLAQGSGAATSSEVPTTAEANTQSYPVSNVLDTKEATSKLQRKLEELHISDDQHVIIPNHLHVPEVEKIGFCFGSFDASFGLNTGYNNGPENDKNPTPLSETSESVEETEEQSSSNQNAMETTEEGDYPDNPQSPRHAPENLSSGEGDVSATVVPEYSESKQETSLPPGTHQSSMIHTSPSYSFGFMPPMVGSQFAPFESSESQVRDVPRLPSFVVPQPIDPASYYAQFYRSGADGDGRISPFHSPGVAMKYNGNVAVLSPQTSQSAQEGGNSLVLSTAGPTPLGTQAAGVMQSSIAVAQQPLPVFRQPTGMPLPHYPPNYIPYGPYFSPFYVPPPALHQFLSNVYPALPGANAKYSISQYKAGTNTGNSTHVGVASSYGPYGSSPAGYNPSSASTAGNSTANEDLSPPQFKENNVYMTGQQSEGSTVWITAPGREISGLQASSFYNIPPQGQVAFAPTQAGHGTFAGIYHPAQAVSATSVHPLLQAVSADHGCSC